MRHISSFCMAIIMLCAFSLNSNAQVGRIFGARQLQLDDGNGNTITIQTPNGGWLGNANFSLPLPPYPGGPSGWIAPGTLNGQIPVWSVALNSWQPQIPSLALNLAANDEPFLTFSPAANLTNSRILNSGLGISLLSSGGFPNGSFTVSNTGVLSNISGAGISVSGPTGDVTIANTGVLSNIPGAGISLSGPTGNVTIDNTGVLSTTAGTGISISSPSGNVTISNTGVIQLLGTPDQVLVNGFGSIGQTGMIQLSTPQDIAPTSSPTFSAITLTGKGTSASTVTGDVGTTLVTKDFVTTPGNVAVLTNTSLVGDGTAGNPLGLNLNNSNTWNADQLLPNSSSQGDNLIATVNASSNTINAVNIGAGLTDAQVNDNLTINGGTIDNTPIGANTASTGAFTTLGANSSVTFSALPTLSGATDLVTSNGGNIETRTISSLGGMIAVNTDASLVGDGTAGNPLGLNLNNSNTWNADQLLPNSSSQGDNLIATVNASSNTINAVNIGVGLTDAQVNDNLTINGGTIDNTPIGANSASTGAFTTLGANSTVTFSALPNGSSATDIVMSNVGSLETRTISSLGGMIAVNTDASLVGDGTAGNPLGLNLNNSNTWNADQLLPNSSSQGDNLIATVNASSNTINAVNIGAGLTDAQVNDNLTINGGVVDNTPIGANTASTGAFTTLGANSSVTFSALPNGSSATDIVMSNVGSLETRTISSLGGMIAVNTNSSLIGDGTVGNPLGLNLENSNTWNADQLLPNSSAQGDNLISSVNASSNTINAVNIGAGLTDAQVNDNLTINGGTIDNTPIGANTASTGAFTTLGANSTVTFSAMPNGSSATDIVMSNVGSLETRTISSLGGMIAVNTNSSLIGDGTVGNPLGLNLENSNTWNADQLLPSTSSQGDNLIAGVNASSNTINAVNIGAGLTDAQVNDNLTINGGTIDNSPIGFNTPNSGAFTTIDGSSLNLTGKGSSASTLSNDPGNTLVTLDYVQTPGNIAVLADATLVGDGSGTPLGINVSHSNTFAAPQFLLVDPSQGDNLIASINSSASTINAVNIGAGLSDAQVNDDLTINGGAIDNSPIGFNTASTGAFTTLDANSTITFSGLPSGSAAIDIVTSNGGVLETRTIASLNNLLSVTTDATLSGNGTSGNPLGLALGNANSWLATQTFPATGAQGDVFITSINSGSAGTLNASQIGVGLTDAQVNDNLTINSGIIDNSPIGNTTRSTGKFTTIDANAPANFVGDGATDVAMLTVKGLDLGTATGNHLLVEGNAHVTQKLTVSGTISASSIDNTPIGGGVRSTGNFTTLDANNGLTVSNNKELTLTGAVNNKYATSNLAAAYGLGPQDYILVCTNAGVGNVNLPANPPTGRTYVIKSMGAGNINVVPANGLVTVDGNIGNYVITGGLNSCITIVCDGTNWFILTK